MDEPNNNSNNSNNNNRQLRIRSKDEEEAQQQEGGALVPLNDGGRGLRNDDAAWEKLFGAQAVAKRPQGATGVLAVMDNSLVMSTTFDVDNFPNAAVTEPPLLLSFRSREKGAIQHSEITMADAKPSSKKALNASAEASSKTEANKTSSPKKRGWDEIESLFDDSKKKKKAAAAATAEMAKKKKHNNSKPPRADKEPGKLKASKMGGDWVDDGLGGVYNAEGYTGRVEEGVRVFKAHVIQQSPDAGNTELCPFDCKCCYM